MVQARIGNNFDIDAITRMVNADVNAPAAADQPFVDPVADAFVIEIEDIRDRLLIDPTSERDQVMRILNSPLAATLPPGTLAELRAVVQQAAEKAANGSDAFMRGDRVWDEREKREEKERKEQAKIADMADDAQNAQQQQAQWSREEHSLGGVTMTGEQWAEMGDAFRSNPYARQWLIAKLMRDRGLSQAQAEQRADEYADTFTAMSKPPSQRTPAERALVERAENDPMIGQIAQAYQARTSDADYPIINPTVQTSLQTTNVNQFVQTRGALLDAPPSPASRNLANAPVEAQTSTFSSGNLRTASVAPTEITGAPPMRDHFRAAHDVQLTTPQPEQPQPIPAVPAATADAGLTF